MNIEEAKAKITELTEEIQRLRKRNGVILVRAEEKAGDEGLRDSQTPSPAYLEENAKLWAEAVKAQQELYRENQRLQCEIDRLSRHPAAEQAARAFLAGLPDRPTQGEGE
jgi:FtsZ-binding cell division protein ZapB